MNLFTELKRRNVFKVATVYLMLSWLILQLVDVVAPILMLPEVFSRIVLMLLIVSLPIILIIAWAFELTPDGIEKTSNVAEDVSIRSSSGQKLNYAIIGFLILVIFSQFFFNKGDTNSSQKDMPQIGQSIAVLPFVNVSEDANNEYFSDGLSEEILNVLTKFPNLKVSGRTSSFSFKGQNQDIRTIGEVLNVDHILEGSVRKSGTQVRITVQLVRTEDGFQIWSETFNRELSNIFVVQEDIARAISTNLALEMDLDDIPALITTKTENMESYDLYLRSRSLLALRGRDNVQKALDLIDEALIIDPDYAAALGMLGLVHSVAYQYEEIETIPEGMFRGEEAARRALKIDPTSSPAHAALGSLLRDQQRSLEALDHFEQALLYDPGHSEAMQQFGQLFLQTGHFSQALPYIQRSIELDPSSFHYVLIEGLALYGNGDREKGRELVLQAVERSMGSIHNPLWSSFLYELDKLAFDEIQNYLMQLKHFAKSDSPRFFNENLIAASTNRATLNSYLEEILEQLSTQPTQINEDVFAAATIYAALAVKIGSQELALSFLEIESSISIEFQDPDTTVLLWIPLFSEIRNHDRFKQIMTRYGLVEFYNNYAWPDQCQLLQDGDFNCTLANNE